MRRKIRPISYWKGFIDCNERFVMLNARKLLAKTSPVPPQACFRIPPSLQTRAFPNLYESQSKKHPI